MSRLISKRKKNEVSGTHDPWAGIVHAGKKKRNKKETKQDKQGKQESA